MITGNIYKYPPVNFRAKCTVLTGWMQKIQIRREAFQLGRTYAAVAVLSRKNQNASQYKLQQHFQV